MADDPADLLLFKGLIRKQRVLSFFYRFSIAFLSLFYRFFLGQSPNCVLQEGVAQRNRAFITASQSKKVANKGKNQVWNWINFLLVQLQVSWAMHIGVQPRAESG